MKATKILRRIGGTILGTVFALLLLIIGLILLLYSPWAQGLLCEKINEKFGGEGDIQLHVANFSLHFPIEIELDSLRMKMTGGMNIEANKAYVDVGILPLLKGRIGVNEIKLDRGRFEMGGPDSVLWLRVNADSIGIAPATVTLSDMDINLEEVAILHGRLQMVMSTDTAPPTPPAPPTKLSITLGKVSLDDFEYTMRMMPAIDTLTAVIDKGTLDGGKVDLLNQHILLGKFLGSGLDAKYIAPDSAEIAAYGPIPTAAPVDTIFDVVPWIIEIDSIGFDHSHALYTTSGYRPTPGLDFGYIEVSDLSVGVHNFYNEATTVRVPLNVEGTERCGVKLHAIGSLDISEADLGLNSFTVTTAAGTDIAFTGLMGMGDMTTDPNVALRLNADADIAPGDLRLMFPLFAPYWAALPKGEPVVAHARIKGTSGDIEIDTVSVALNHCVSLAAGGRIHDVFDIDRMYGNVDLSGRIINVNSFKKALLDPATAATLNIPSMTLKGDVKIRPHMIVNAILKAHTGNGQLRLDALWNSKKEDYNASLTTRSFPVQAFMPLAGVSDVTADLSLEGTGYDPFKPLTQMKASAMISSATYGGYTYSGISAEAIVDGGQASIKLDSDNPGLDVAIRANGNLAGDIYKWSAEIDGNYIDLQTLKFSDTPASIETQITADAELGPGMNNLTANINVKDLFYRQVDGTIALSDVIARFKATDGQGVKLNLVNHDLTADFTSPLRLDTLMARFSALGELVTSQINRRDFEIDTIQRVLPPFDFALKGGNYNLINDVLAPSNMGLQSIKLNAHNDSTLALTGRILSFYSGTTNIDTIYVAGGQHHDHLHLLAGIGNRPGTLDALARVWLHATVDGNQARLNLQQKNIKGDIGFKLGFKAEFADSAVTVSVNPFNPIIGYQPWEANPDNFIEYYFPTGHIDANLHMRGGKSALAIYTEASGETPTSHNEHSHDTQDDLIVQLTDIHIQDWIVLNPFAPPMTGDVSADVRLNRSGDHLLGSGSVGLSDFLYNRQKVDDIGATFNVSADASGQINAAADLLISGKEVMKLRGVLNDSIVKSPMMMDLSVINLPLSVANPFIPKTIGSLRGTLNGSMEVTGKTGNPTLNGWLAFDSTAVKLTLTGTEYAFNSVKIPVEKSKVEFRGFTISGTNDHPLTVNGYVNLTDFANPSIDIRLKTTDMQIVNSNRARAGADVYGKAFIDLDAAAKGNMKFMNVDANLKILPGTNVTYVIPAATSEIANYSAGEMVKFVNFTDSAAMARAEEMDESTLALLLNAVLTIENGATINVDLSADGTNKVSISPTGTVDYTMTPMNTGRLTGRINLNSGFVRYTPPLMSEKQFFFQEGSYVAFNGDIMNPTLNVHAVDEVKANVTQEGQNSRLINFNVGLGVTGTLNNMNVAFNLSTKDDITVANELESMSPEQRANQAMNLLLYNVYTGPGTTGNASLGNPLFSFLESQLNSWAANTIKGVDLSFGINQYDKTVNGSTSSAMSYSYQVSKSLFNDRFKIIVGGNYSTDANADENFSQNLISDISLEYFLNNNRTMYVRLFRHTGFESILEGEVTQTGVGFAYRKKVLKLIDIFRGRKKTQEVKTATEAIKPEEENAKEVRKNEDE